MGLDNDRSITDPAFRTEFPRISYDSQASSPSARWKRLGAGGVVGTIALSLGISSIVWLHLSLIPTLFILSAGACYAWGAYPMARDFYDKMIGNCDKGPAEINNMLPPTLGDLLYEKN